MNIGFTQEHLRLQETVRAFAEKEVAPLDAAMDRSGEFPHDLFRKMRQAGLFGILVPSEYGGMGAGFTATVLAIYELAQASASVAVSMDAHWLACETILAYGTDAQKQAYLGRAAADTLFAFSLTEPHSGSDAAGIQSTALLQGDSYVLNGAKAWCTNGGVAGVYVILAKTDKFKGAKGISAFIVEADNPGLGIGRMEDKMGMRGSQTGWLQLKDCQVGKENLLGPEGGGFNLAVHGLSSSRIFMSAIAAGLAEAAMTLAKDHARRRVAFGSPIANFQATQFTIAEMVTGLEAARLMTFDAASLKEQGKPHAKEAAMAKLFSSRHAVRTCMDAIQVLGGYGYSRDYPAERLLRDAKLTELGDGTTEILKILIGRTELASF